MSILSAPRLLSQQRLDKEDLDVLFTSIETDWKYFIGKFFADTAYILNGFLVSGLGGPSPAYITLAGSTLINPENTGCFSFFSGEPSAAPLQVTLTPSTRNYIELELSTTDGTPLTRAFWDPSAQGGLGAEFNQTVNTVTNLTVSAVALTGGFSGSPNRVPVCWIDTDSGNNIKIIKDKRALFGRLGTPNNPDADYAWGTRTEPELTLNLTGVSGVFQAGEEVTIGGVSSICQSPGTSVIGVTYLASDAISAGATVIGISSGATATLATAIDQFTGADKSINNIREMFEAFATEIKAIKGTRIWSAEAPISLQDVADAFDAPAYEEFIEIVSSGATGNQLNAPITSGTTITIPAHSRLLGAPQQYYEVGKGWLEVRLNGQVLQLGVPLGWSEVGISGAQSSQITINQDLYAGDVLSFRLDGEGGPGSGGGSSAPDDNFITLASSNAADNADYVLIWDSSVGAYRRQLRSVFLAGISGSTYNINTYTADRTVDSNLDAVILMNCASGPLNVFLPTPSICQGKRFEIKKIDSTANAMTVDGGVANIDFATTVSTILPGDTFSVISDGTQYWLI